MTPTDLSVALERQSHAPEVERVDVDHGRGLERDEGVADQHPGERSVGERSPRQVEACVKHQLSTMFLVDRYPQATLLVSDTDPIPTRHPDERRHVEVLVHPRLEGR